MKFQTHMEDFGRLFSVNRTPLNLQYGSQKQDEIMDVIYFPYSLLPNIYAMFD